MLVIVTVHTFPYSAFLRGPTRVLPSLIDADVVLERRDEENLVLMRAERFEASYQKASLQRNGSMAGHIERNMNHWSG